MTWRSRRELVGSAVGSRENAEVYGFLTSPVVFTGVTPLMGHLESVLRMLTAVDFEVGRAY